MRALVFKGVGHPLVLDHIPDPVPEPDQVILKVGRCGICGTDLHRTEENIFSLKPGAVPGHELSGEVVALGRETSGLAIGDRVTALPYVGCGRCLECISGSPNFCRSVRNIGSDDLAGGYAEYVAVGAPWTVKLPDALSLEDGALIEPLAVGLHGVQRAGLRAGVRVLVIGAGPIGLACVYWARRTGAAKIAVTAASNRRADMARAMGADTFVTTNDGPSLSNSVAAALGGPADVVFECVGLPGLLDKAISCVRIRGVVVVLGVCVQPDPFMPIMALAKEVDIRFSQVYNLREFEVAVDAMESGDVEPRTMITDVVNLEAAPAAFEALRHRTHQCKVLISPWS
jgi:threonine dehydrogenase-like Zn-dependent dehydrogenase